MDGLGQHSLGYQRIAGQVVMGRPNPEGVSNEGITSARKQHERVARLQLSIALSENGIVLAIDSIGYT